MFAASALPRASSTAPTQQSRCCCQAGGEAADRPPCAPAARRTGRPLLSLVARVAVPRARPTAPGTRAGAGAGATGHGLLHGVVAWPARLLCGGSARWTREREECGQAFYKQYNTRRSRVRAHRGSRDLIMTLSRAQAPLTKSACDLSNCKTGHSTNLRVFVAGFTVLLEDSQIPT